MRRLSLLLALGLATLGWADPIDDLVRAEMTANKAPAVAIAVIRDGKVIRSQAYGIIDVEHNVPATPDSVFRVASMSKEFCSAATLLLIQDGKASLTDSVRKFLPEAPASWEPITLHHLLSHTSGMPDVDADDGFYFETTWSAETYLKKLYAKPLKRKPGEKYEYSNPGYSVLGLIVGKIAGKPLEEVVSERILAPIGMSQTRYYHPNQLVMNRAMGYERGKDGIGNALFIRPAMMQGSGGLLSSVVDFAKWDAALRTTSPLSAEIKSKLWTGHIPASNGMQYGYGWFIQNRDGKAVVRHSGGTVGFTSNFIRYLDDGLTVVVLENVASGGAVKLSEAIADYYLSEAKKEAPAKIAGALPVR